MIKVNSILTVVYANIVFKKKKGFFSKAFDELQRLQNEAPTYLQARVALGVLYYGRGQILEAQSQWEKVLVKDPHNKEAGMYLNLSQTATETKLT